MKLERAVKIIVQRIASPHLPWNAEDFRALKLSIEAVRFRQRWEQQEGEDDFPLLPGETEE